MSRSNLLHGDLSANHYVAVTPHDSTDFTDGVCDGLYIGGTGNVVAVRPDGTAVTLT